MKNSKSSKISSRVELFLKRFSEEAPEVRDELANSLPAYNILLNLHATTFEEMSLRPYAIEQGFNICDPLFDYERVKPACPNCGKITGITKMSDNRYRCNACMVVYSINKNCIVSGTKLSSLTWMKVLYCILEHYSIEKTCNYCSISHSSYYNIRNKLFYAMELMMEDVKLYGVIQCDNTPYHLSYKGTNLSESDYPEDSIYNIAEYIPRSARKRGGAYSKKQQNVNEVCVFTAIDNYGHVATRYVGIGSATATKLMKAVPGEKYLFDIPEKDPFAYSYNPPVIDESTNRKSLLVADKEAAIEKYARNIGICLEAHVYRRHNKQVKLPGDAHNIQKANALHKRLREFISDTNYVSTKYLKGILCLFEFVENTGATYEAIGRLFEILVTPELGQSPKFYEDLYKTPNYYIELEADDADLRKLPYNQALAAYLYHKKTIELKETGKTSITVDTILEETGYKSRSSIRTIYNNFVASGIIDKVYEKMNRDNKIKLVVEKKKSKKSKNSRNETKKSAVPEIWLELYDAVYANYLSGKKTTTEKLLDEFNQNYNTKFTSNHLDYYFTQIEDKRLRTTSIENIKKQYKKNKTRRNYRENPTEEMIERARVVYAIYDEIYIECQKNNQKLPRTDTLYCIISERTGYSEKMIREHLTTARKLKDKGLL